MFSELDAIKGPGRRINWMLGAAAIVLAAVEARALTMLSRRMRAALVLALGAALVCGILSYADANAVRVDDDLFAALSVANAAALITLAAIAARKIFSGPEFGPGEGR